jgi:biotin carboxylase
MDVRKLAPTLIFEMHSFSESEMKKVDYFWVIGGGEMQIPVIDEARSLGLKIICSDLSASCACAQLADIFFPIDVFDIDAHVLKAIEISKTLHIAGVLAAGIDAPETMACIAQALGLPGVDPEIARLVHNKADFRRRLDALGFPVPRYADFGEDQLSEVVALAQGIGYPLVLKNTDSSGSRGTRIFYRPDDEALRIAAIDAIRVSHSRRALIESFWEGPEQTIETLFDVHGNFHPCFITDRLFDKQEGYAIETALRHPTTLGEDVQAEMYRMAYEVAKAIGIRIGAAKYDCILTSQGPRIIEMTVRLSGGFDCQYLVPAATGKNVILAAVLTAMGRPFPTELLHAKYHRIAVSRSLWPHPGLIRAVSGLEDARKIPGVEKIVMRKTEGDLIEPYTDCTKRVCFVIAVADTQEAVDAVVAQVEQTIKIDVEAL